MPDAMINPKGPYEVNRRLRRVEERQEKWDRRNRRTRRSQPKNSIWRVLKLLAYYFTYNFLIIAFAIGYFLLIIDNKHIHQKGTSLSSVPGFTDGIVKVIRYKENQRKEISPYINQIEKFVKKYGAEGMHHLQACNLDNYWGYHSGLPCILLKLNFAVNFTADTYDDSITLPKEVPDELYDYILQLSVEDRTNRIWAACNFMGNETIGGIEYVPYRYYDSDGLFTMGNSYLRTISENLTEEVIQEDPAYRRVIGVQFNNLPLNRDIYVKCSVWAKNIPLKYATTIFKLHVEGLDIRPKIEDDYSL